jgi:hypothetical protein
MRSILALAFLAWFDRSSAGAQPCTPRDPSIAVRLSGSTVDLSWTEVAGATAYELEAWFTPTAPALTVSLPPDVRRFSRAVADGVYFVRVRAIAACGSSTGANGVFVSVPCATPAPVLTLAPGPLHEAKLSWSTTDPSSSQYALEVVALPHDADAFAVATRGTRGTFTFGLAPATYVAWLRSPACNGMLRSNEVVFTIVP